MSRHFSDLDSILEFDALNDLWQLVLTFQSPPCWRTTSKASARVIQASLPVNATAAWSTALVTSFFCIGQGRSRSGVKRINYRLAFFLAGFRSRTLAAAGFFFSASILALRASKRLTTFGAGACFAGSIFFPACLRSIRSFKALS